MIFYLHRKVINGKGVLGTILYNRQHPYLAANYNNESNIEVCKTLELPWNYNKRNISCIPAGIYKFYYDRDIGRFWVLNVLDRTNIQIHIGNNALVNNPKSDTTGCILTGMRWNSSHTFIYDSEKGFNRLKELCFGDSYQVAEHTLIIIDKSYKTYLPNLNSNIDMYPMEKWTHIFKPHLPLEYTPQQILKKGIAESYKGGKFWYNLIHEEKWKLWSGYILGTASVIFSFFNPAVSQVLAGGSLGLIGVGGIQGAKHSEPSWDGKTGKLYIIVKMVLDTIKEIILKISSKNE